MFAAATLAYRSRVDAAVRQVAATRRLISALLASIVLASSAAAGPFSELVIFGDSLSDVGNVQQATEALWIFNVDPTPGPYYYNGRFSNGPVYIERLAAGLGLPAPVHNRSGGTNFAHGGAKTTGTTGLQSLVVRDIDDQIADFMPSAPADPDALYVLFAGANDILDVNLSLTDLETSANRIRDGIEDLAAVGARQFLVLNQPLMGETPRFRLSSRTTYNERSEAFNDELSLALNNLESINPALTIFQFDVAALFGQAIDNPAAFGLVNVTQAAAPGLQPGAETYNTALIAANANQYLFWDDLHPTTTVHSILARHALAQVSQGDFNWDGVVDAADYVMWRKEFASTIDFDEWSSNFGELTGGGGGGLEGSGGVAPEPSSVVIMVLGAAFFAWCGPRKVLGTRNPHSG